jgi:alkylation response protein AidB-like acyl-CoA dehydrogenase
MASTTNTEGISDADRVLLRDSIRGFLESRWPAAQAVEKASDPGEIAALWSAMSEQGLASLGADPAEGGLREILLAFEELGRAACPAPMLGSVVANLALAPRRAASKSAGELLDALAQGKARVAAAFGAFDGDAEAGRVDARDGKLQGSIAFVESGAGATHFLAFTDSPAGAAIVSAGAPGLTVTATPGLQVPPFSMLAFDKTPASLVSIDAPALRDLAAIARLCCAARALGAAQRTFELAVDHAKVRKQFGQLIGSFQAIQHKLANSLINLDGVRLTLAQAAEARDNGSRDWRVFGAAALAFAGPALREVAIQNHRALGAIGYAEEHEAPRHFRRVHADVARFGGAPRARAELADFILGAKS